MSQVISQGGLVQAGRGFLSPRVHRGTLHVPDPDGRTAVRTPAGIRQRFIDSDMIKPPQEILYGRRCGKWGDRGVNY